ncbi:MAG: hypothetical protein ABEJ40_00615 [Haloarculaceae archaeon]
MNYLDLLIGASASQRLVVIGTVVVYVALAARRPAAARESAAGGLRRFARLGSLIVAALLLASAVQTLLPAALVRSYLGEAAGPPGVLLAGFVGGALPGGPYAAYPIVRGIADQGAGLPAVVAMVTGYGAIGLARLPYGLVFFDARTVATRVAVGVAGTALVAGTAVVLLS